MSVYFLDLKYGHVLDCSYALETGRALEQLDFEKFRYSVGDEVSLMLDLPKWRYLAIKDNCIDKLVDARSDPRDSNYVSVDFVIARKRHVLVHSRQAFAHLQPHSPSLYLKPISWGHEDIFKWVCMGITPTWITEEEIAEYKESFQEAA